MIVRVLVLFLFVQCITNLIGQSEPLPYGAIPTSRQLTWHETELYGLIHFTPTTFENKEWGYGDADPSIFNPLLFDATQIVNAAKAGGLKGIIFVAKHHDGFCLWPTKTTEYNISKSPWRNGKGDMVKEIEQACRKAGLQFGVYCSPWDRNSAVYGTDTYLKIYREQLKELYSNYGPLFMSWHDGANGGDGYYGGAKEKRKIDNTVYYDWDNTWNDLTRKMQPTANIFSDIGLDVRWVGNEKGIAHETHWASFDPKPESGSKAVPGNVDTRTSSEGTRNGKTWIPAECDVPLRPGWFYHPEQDGKEKSADALFDLYLKSVGRGACLDLGLAPTTEGLLHKNDVNILKNFGERLKNTFIVNYINGAKIKATNSRGKSYKTAYLTDKDRYSYWATQDGSNESTIEIKLKGKKTFDLIQLRENIKLGQRIESVSVDYFTGSEWKKMAAITTVGANRLIKLDNEITCDKIRIHIQAMAPICLSEMGLYKIR